MSFTHCDNCGEPWSRHSSACAVSLTVTSNAKAWIDGTLSVPCPRCAALVAQVERLREALEKIIRKAETIDEAEATAHEALREKP